MSIDKIYKKRAFKILLFPCVITVLLFALYFSGFRLNLTVSLPYRVFRIYPLNAGDILKSGDCVVVDTLQIRHPSIREAADRHYLNLNIPLVKQIGAVSGDTVTVNGSHIFINGVETPVIVLSEDRHQRPLTAYPTPVVIPENAYWLTSDPVRGFDSRYFGPVPRSFFLFRAEPVY